ncbi:MAG: TonB-dependent receptor, partial [Pedobacter sp.]
MFLTPASVGILASRQLRVHSPNSLVAAMNTLPGIRMEERSPASYRLSIRGSLLRSPFGVRNVKIYFDEMPLTDASGNTYLNGLDISALNNIEILKGPDGSLFGANSGGVMLIDPLGSRRDSSRLSLNINGGSYGLFHEHIAYRDKGRNNEISVQQSYQQSDGYRDNSNMNRHYIQLADRYNYGNGNQLKLIGFYSDLNYKTPGGLTLAQMESNPKSARPATATLPGAIEQQIGIQTSMLYGGLVNEWRISNRIRNVASVFGSTV